MKILITGGCGFLGANLAQEALVRGCSLVIFDNLSRHGSAQNLEWLQSQGNFVWIQGDVRCQSEIEHAVRSAQPDVIFHLAGQVAMTTSIVDPRLDFETNVIGGFNVLEAGRRYAPLALITYSSTNKVYGGLENVTTVETETRYLMPDFPNGLDESFPLDFQGPYGCSKGSIDQFMLDYARTYNLRTVVFRHSSIFGGRQFSTSDQGWIGWFVKKAIEKQACPLEPPFTIAGTGKQVRDILFATDLVKCYFQAVKHMDRAAGQAFNIGGGTANSLSLVELFAFLESSLGVNLTYARTPWRQADQKVFIADTRKARRLLDWEPTVDKTTGLRHMIDWVRDHG